MRWLPLASLALLIVPSVPAGDVETYRYAAGGGLTTAQGSGFVHAWCVDAAAIGALGCTVAWGDRDAVRVEVVDDVLGPAHFVWLNEGCSSGDQTYDGAFSGAIVLRAAGCRDLTLMPQVNQATVGTIRILPA